MTTAKVQRRRRSRLIFIRVILTYMFGHYHGNRTKQTSSGRAFFHDRATNRFRYFNVISLRSFIKGFAIRHFQVRVLTRTFSTMLVRIIQVKVSKSFQINTSRLCYTIKDFLRMTTNTKGNATNTGADRRVHSLVVTNFPSFQANNIMITFQPIQVIVLIQTVPSQGYFNRTFHRLVMKTQVVQAHVNENCSRFYAMYTRCHTLNFKSLIQRNRGNTMTTLLHRRNGSSTNVTKNQLRGRTTQLRFTTTFNHIGSTFHGTIFKKTTEVRVFSFSYSNNFSTINRITRFGRQDITSRFKGKIISNRIISLQEIVSINFQ